MDALSQNYGKSSLWADISAGLTVSVIMIPQAIAYAMLAGLPPIYGLAAAFAPAMLYALIGTSRQISPGPTALIAIVITAGIGKLAPPFSQGYITLVLITGGCIGIIKILLGLFKFGDIIRLLSHPVMYGFISAAAVIIITSQIKEILGIKPPNLTYFHQKISFFTQNISRSNYICLGMFIVSLASIFFLKKWNKKFPAALLVATVFSLVTAYFDLDNLGIAVIGDIPQGVPGVSFDFLSGVNTETLWQMTPTVLTAAFISIIECATIAKSLELKTKTSTVDPNRELVAMGLAKIVGAFMQTTAISASFSRSSINHSSGAKTTVSLIITAIIVLLTLLFITPIFYYFPRVVLASIICNSVLNLIYASKFKLLWKTNKEEFFILIVSFLCTIFLGIQIGISIGFVLSFIIILYHATGSKCMLLKEKNGTLSFEVKGVLYCGNVNNITKFIDASLEKKSNVKAIHLHLTEVSYIDATSVELLESLKQKLTQKHITLQLLQK